MELSVSAAIMGLIMTGLWYMMQAGTRYVRVTNATIEVQQACMSALGRVSQELGESSHWGVRMGDSSVVFWSPRDESGRVRYDSQNRILWQKAVAYYVEMVNGVSSLVRKEQMLDHPSSKPPDTPTAESMRNDTALRPRVVAQDIVLLDVAFGAGGEELEGVDDKNLVTLKAAAELQTIERKDATHDFRMEIMTRVILKN